MGALGLLLGSRIAESSAGEDFVFIMAEKRLARHRKDIYSSAVKIEEEFYEYECQTYLPLMWRE